MLEKVVAAIDGDRPRAAAVVRAVSELARDRPTSVLVVRVQEVERPATLAGTPRPGALVPLHPEAIDDDGGTLVSESVEQLRGQGVTAEGRVQPGAGSGARELVEIADAFAATLIVVGDRGSRLTDVLMGSVASKVLHSARCSVLLVR